VAVVAILVWLSVRRTDLEWGLAVALAGGLLVSHHAYMADCALLLPVLLTILAKAAAPWQRSLALFLLTPVPYIFMLMDSTAITRAALILFFIGLAWSSINAEVKRLPASFLPPLPNTGKP